ncbi:MAG: tetratricopeptide repeat protein [Candidatus Helarchaeota archaeon]
MIETLLLSVCLLNISIGDYVSVFDSTKFKEYFISAAKSLENQQDSILLMGKVSIFGWDVDSNFIKIDSGVHIIFRDGMDYISTETEKEGLFYFLIFYPPNRFINSINLIGFRYGSLVIPIGDSPTKFERILDVAFIKAHTRINQGNTAEDTMSQWGYEFSDGSFDMLELFCQMHPDHNFASVTQSLLEDMQVKYIADSLIGEKQFSEAKRLLVEAFNSKKGSRYLIFSLLDFYLRWADEQFIQKDTIGTLDILRDCLRVADSFDRSGRVLKLLLLASLDENRYQPLFIFPPPECNFGKMVETELLCDFLSLFTTESQRYAIRYIGYKDKYNYRKAEGICYEWLKRFPDDSLPYHYFIDFYNSMNFIIDKERIKKIIAVGKKMVKNHIDIDANAYMSFGDMCYKQKMFREAVFFYETKPEALDRLCFHLSHYIISLNRIGEKDKAKTYFEKALQLSSGDKLFTMIKYHILIESGIELSLFTVVDSLFKEANVKLDKFKLLRLKTDMARQYLEIKQKDICLQLLLDVLEQDSTCSAAWHVLGDFYAQTDFIDSSIICYQKAYGYGRDEYMKIDLVLKISSCYLKKKNTAELVSLLCDFLKEHKDEPYYEYYTRKIKRWCELKRLDDILEMLSPMLGS